jgi:ubiquinone biosynthesis protein
MMVRLFQIAVVAVRYRLDEFALPAAKERGLGWLLPSGWRTPSNEPAGARLRFALEELGPVFVKFGQLLSVRPDLIPEEITAALSGLRDRVQPVPSDIIVSSVERAYGQPVDEVFATFEHEPLASASIAQVHRASLADGTRVVVKVVRPKIRSTIDRDIALLRRVARLLERFWPDARRLQACEVVNEYDTIIHDELDMVREASSASLLARNFAAGDVLEVPKVHWLYTRHNVLVLDEIEGIPIDRVDALRAAGVDLAKLAERGVQIFFKQVFQDNFFHADMHPGNIFVSPGDGEREATYQAVDFGIMGSLSREDQTYLAENFLAFFRRDYRRVAELHVASAWVPAGTRVAAFEAEIRSVCEPVFQRSLGDISFAQLLVRLFRTARRFDMHVQPQLVLLQKTLLHIEGLGRQLHPQLDLWATAKPFFEQWMATRTGPKAILASVEHALPRWAALAAELGPDLPDIIRRTARGSAVPVLQDKPVPLSASAYIAPLCCAALGLAIVWVGQHAGAGWLLTGIGVGLFLAAIGRG